MGNASNRQEVPVFGISSTGEVQWVFYVIHVVALCSLVTSLIISSGVVAYMFKSDKTNIFKRPIGDRLVFYLALCDLAYSLSHCLDHVYMLGVLGNTTVPLCVLFAFFLQTFIVAQCIMVLFTALNAFMMVVRSQRIPLGKYDWRLLSVAVGVPACVGVVGAAVPFLGQSGPWCLVDMGQPWGPAINNVYGIAMVIVFSVNLFSYGVIWLKLKQAAKKLNDQGGDKYHKTARVMMLFVVAYLLQWWPYVVQALWSFAEPPHVAIYIIAVVFCNCGGLFNFLAYTLIRKKYQKVGSQENSSKAKQEESTKPVTMDEST